MGLLVPDDDLMAAPGPLISPGSTVVYLFSILALGRPLGIRLTVSLYLYADGDCSADRIDSLGRWISAFRSTLHFHSHFAGRNPELGVSEPAGEGPEKRQPCQQEEFFHPGMPKKDVGQCFSLGKSAYPPGPNRIVVSRTFVSMKTRENDMRYFEKLTSAYRWLHPERNLGRLEDSSDVPVQSINLTSGAELMLLISCISLGNSVL
uniref:Uncharacterized protein n=1 Tax=Anopheles atroparvus TaxID=41427 RepID=A0A182IYE9_ANOAO